ncbi:MAG: efflux RND transporter permease subunit [Candidatus Puniceispirillaceae bacterium]
MFANMIEFFARHRTAANIVMVVMIITGIISADRLNRQFFPDVDVEIVAVSVVWSGATAEDVDSNIIQPLEPELRTIANVKKVSSTSFEGIGQTQVEFEFGTDMQKALADVEAAVGQVDFPLEAEAPKVIKGEFSDTITRIVLHGPFPIDALRFYAKGIKEDLLQIGVDKVDILGLPSEEILIEINEDELSRLGLTLNAISSAISSVSVDVPAGRFADGALRVRSLGLEKDANGYREIEILARADGSNVLLGDVATVTDTYQMPAILQYHKGQPAVELHVQRGKTSDSLTVNQLVQDYVKDKQAELPENLSLDQHEIAAVLISERINLMIKNGIGGLLIVTIVLFLFLSARVAFWVAAGIPVAFLATFSVMLISGQSINMISLFGLIMALGIVVDDAIVIGEHAEYLKQKRNLPISEASVLAAKRMGPPVISAMLTTVAAFLPLFMVKGIIGVIIGAIPAVVCAVLVASLVECFFILPAHLAHYGASKRQQPSWFRRNFDAGFNYFRDAIFYNLVLAAFRFRYVTFAFAIGLLLFAVGMMAGGRVNFVFFSAPEADRVFANVTMASGSTRSQTATMLEEVERALDTVEERLTQDNSELISFAYSKIGGSFSGDQGTPTGGANELLAGMVIELKTADERSVRVDSFIEALRAEIQPKPGLERLIVRAPAGGPPGRELDIRLMGNDLELLKSSALDIVQIVDALPGTTDIDENLDYGAEERIIRLTSFGRSLGFTVSSVGNQVRSALDGAVVKRFPRGDEEVTVRLALPKGDIATDSLGDLTLITPQGSIVDLADVATIEPRLGFSVVRRQDGFREVAIQGDLDDKIITTSQAKEALLNDGLAEDVASKGLRFRFDGRDQEQGEAFADMSTGGTLALLCIYVILAWVFSSWSRPFAVMIMIPFGLIGAVVGHYVMGLSMNILSLFALIALSGIVVNNSIILVATIERRLEELDGAFEQSVVSGATDRLRPVLLTSMTTIGGLSTLMFETSLQAQFLIPMATTIVFGLAVTTALVLFLVPATLGIGRDLEQLVKRLLSPLRRLGSGGNVQKASD